MDNIFVNVFLMKDKIYVMSESNFIFEINFDILDILKRVNFIEEFLGKEDIVISKCFNVICSGFCLFFIDNFVLIIFYFK